jgi:predicted ATP-grasp superfamily ATP-dependent carboligase
MALARLTSKLQQRFPASLPAPTTLTSLIDKESLGRTLAANNIARPRTIPLHTESDLRQALREIPAGSFLKPRNSELFFQRYLVKAFRLHSLAEALKYYDDVRRHNLEVVLQEYIPGPPSNHYFIDGFVDRTGRVCATFVRQRLRMYPPDFGNSSYMISVPAERAAMAITDLTQLFAAVKYRGIYSAEFKFDGRDGRFKLLEVNVRPWWYIWFAATSGVPVAEMAYRDAQGIEVKPVQSYAVGRQLVYPLYDLHACLELYRQGGLGLLSWAGSWLGADRAITYWRDPLPALSLLSGEAGRVIRKWIFHRNE